MNPLSTLQQICADLTKQGWSVQDNFTEYSLIQQLIQECRNQHSLGLLKEAGIGRGENHALQKSIRGDQIRWLGEGMSASTTTWLALMDNLRQQLNEQLFLGLKSNETHFAVYPPGAFYKKHVDRFRDDRLQNKDDRILSSILYLNHEWKPGDGGELRLHLDGQHYDIQPIANRLVLFISAEIWHEVLPTRVARSSLTGWYKGSK